MLNPVICDHCHRQRECLTQLIPWTLRHAPITPSLRASVTAMQLCRACAEQRQRDVLDFLGGGPPTTLVCDGASR